MVAAEIIGVSAATNTQLGHLQVSACQMVFYYLSGNWTKQHMGAMTSECMLKEVKNKANEKSNQYNWYFKTSSTALGNGLTRACIKDKEGRS